jgi:hypothetical protein
MKKINNVLMTGWYLPDIIMMKLLLGIGKNNFKQF